MRTLAESEIDQVNGGGWAVPLALGAAAVGTGFAGYRAGGWGGAALGVVFGVAAAGAGAMIGATTGLVRVAWAVRAAGWTGAGGLAGGGHHITRAPNP